MKSLFLLLSALMLLSSMPAFASQPFQISGLVRTISLYENYLKEPSKFDTQTLSIYALYSWRCKSEFLTELTVDINADAPDDLYTDYYMELQLIKPIGKGFSVRIKDVEGTYMERIVRVGVGYDF